MMNSEIYNQTFTQSSSSSSSSIIHHNICIVNLCQLIITGLICMLLLSTGIYILYKYRDKYFRTLLFFHNLRSTCELLLLIINTFELASALLPIPISFIVPIQIQSNATANDIQTEIIKKITNIIEAIAIIPENINLLNLPQLNGHALMISVPFTIWNSILAIFSTICLIGYHRIVEIKNIPDYLYISTVAESFLLLTRIYKVTEITQDHSITELEPFLQASTTFLLTCLFILDCITIYKQRLKPIIDDKISANQYDNIGYKHSISTYFSKITFWWLTPLLWRGYHEPLEQDDLGDLREEDSAKYHYDQFLFIYKAAAAKSKNPSLWLCYLKSSWKMFTLGGILKLFGDLSALIGPLSIHQIVEFIEHQYNTTSTTTATTQMITITNSTINSVVPLVTAATIASAAIIMNMNTPTNITATTTITNSLSNIPATVIGTTVTTMNPYQYENQQRQMFSNQKLKQQQQQNDSNKDSSIILEGYNIDSFILPNNYDYLKNFNNNTTNINKSNSNYIQNINTNNNNNDNYNDQPINNHQFKLMNNNNKKNTMMKKKKKKNSSSIIPENLLPVNITISSHQNTMIIYYPGWNELLSNGWIIAWLVLIASLIQGGLSQASTHLLNMTGIRIKTSLQGLIYRKTLLLSSSLLGTTNDNIDNNKHLENNDNNQCNNKTLLKSSSIVVNNTKIIDKNILKNSHKKHQNNINHNRKGSNTIYCAKDAGAITNLMSEDAINIMSFFWIVHYVWAIPLKIGLVMYLLYLKLGISAIIGSFVCILTMTPLQFLIGKAMSKNSEKAAECTDERLKKTNDIFLGIKIIKLNAWEKVFRNKLIDCRKQELKYLNKDSIYWTLMTFLTHVSSVLITFVTLAVYTRLDTDNSILNKSLYQLNNDQNFMNTTNEYMTSGGKGGFDGGIGNGGINNNNRQNIENLTYTFMNEFTASRLFSALALFNQLTVPLLIFPITVPIIISAIVSTKRLERFLQEPEVQKEFEGVRNMARILSKSDASLDMYENDHDTTDKMTTMTAVTMATTTTTTTTTAPSVSSIGTALNLNNATTSKPIPFTTTSSTLPMTIISSKYSIIDNNKRQSISIINGNENEKIFDEKFENNSNLKTDKRCSNNFVLPPPTSSSSSSSSLTLLSSPTASSSLTTTTTTTATTNATANNTTTTKDNLNRNDSKKMLKNYHYYHSHSRHLPQHQHQHHSKYQQPPKKGKELMRNSRIEKASSRHRHKIITNRESIQFQTSDSIAVSIDNAVFSWNNCNTMLKIDNVQIPKGKLTVVVGKSGSGKTSFLAALLKEMQQISGEVIWNKYSTIAYVPQIPWLLNSSIRENILFGESFRPKRYDKVLEACALKPDIELMPENDMTIIGERGINLSGGQKQRIVIARSLYSSANVIIMDDPFSSLDNEVAKHVFENSIKKMLLKANRTVILVTQKLKLTYYSDYIIVIKDGYVQCSGSLNNIENQYPELIAEWNTIMAKGNEIEDISNSGKTARERWKLFKNVSKMGLLRSSQSVEQNETGSTQSLYKQNIRRSSIFGSRHLIYDIPLPIDECQNDDIIIQRRCGSGGGVGGSSTSNIINNNNRRSCINNSIDFGGSGSSIIIERKNVLRVNSLQPQAALKTERAPVVRNISSPTSLYLDSKYRTADNDFKTKSGFRQFLHRMSSRKSNTAVGARIHRAISASNSIQSISEESHPTLKRSSSEASSDYLDDESVHDLTDDGFSNFLYDEERKYGEIPLDIYILYLKSCKLWIVIIFFIGVLIWQGLRVYTDVWLRNWADSNNNNNNNNNKLNTKCDINYYFNKYTIISIICIIMSLISTPTGQLAGCYARKIIYNKLLDSILTKSLYFYQITPFGRIINRFSNDMAIIDKKIAATSIRLLHFSLLCLCAVLINITITPWFIILTIPIGIAYYIIQKFYRCSSRELQRIENITNSPVISHFTETIQGVTTIRAYSQEARFTEILFRRLEVNTVAFIILNTSNRWLGIALDYLGGMIVFVAILTALIVAKTTSSIVQMNENNDDSMNIIDVTNDKNITNTSINEENNDDNISDNMFLSPSLVGLAINYTLLIPIYLNWVVKLLADMEMYIGSVERVAYYSSEYNNEIPSSSLSESSSSTAAVGPVAATSTTVSSSSFSYYGNSLNQINYKPVPISWPQKGDIVFENVCLRYQGQKQNVIHNLSLIIPAGQKIGICGRTGSGKSSLALSLFGALEVTQGRVLVDDVDITLVHPDEIRSRFSIIPQDVHLFSATIRENLDPHGYYTDLELWNCLELAQLKDIVNAMPFGLDTEIIEGGQNLSAGHRQLFCLARAVLRGSVCLVLDEATSSLDSLTENALLEAAHNAFNGRTIITIAHRLSTLLNYNRIIVLENGIIVEDGTPKELQQNADGKFLQMLKSGNT